MVEQIKNILSVFEEVSKENISISVIYKGKNILLSSEKIEEEDDDKYTGLTLVSVGKYKLSVIKAIKDCFDLGLKEAKDLVDNIPSSLPSVLNSRITEVVKTLSDAGAKVKLT